MKKVNDKNINTPDFWDSHIAETDLGLRQKKYLKLAGKGSTIIELGCGLSPFLSKVQKNFDQCIGVDFSQKTVDSAQKKFGNKHLNYYCEDATNTSWPDGLFDVSVAGELIEHLKEPNKLLAEMVRITKRRIILSTAKMEYHEPEHLWEFSKEDFPMGKVEEIKSDRYKGRSYLFITIDL